ncbi:CRAL-TRIO domain-containing protein [Massariosphaeria phaeospora]|uniref:Phosphatidylinositol transfer protein SFH5 n=1 Tax=Massariosphaeria phaeospora TaxID=100035 RepID=A0A7C8IG79_9PLEO|nr:CRAL-TRIO domain-containing protein [Massariosphaeria phaeospora]
MASNANDVDTNTGSAPGVAEKKELLSQETNAGAAAAPVPAAAILTEEKTEDPLAPENKAEEATAAVAAAPIPAATGPAATSTTNPTWPETSPDHPLTTFFASISALTKEAEYNEIYGVTLSASTPFHTKLILQKFLRANANDLPKAKEQLLETLKWRKEFDPTRAAAESFDRERFGGLGYVVELQGVPNSVNVKDVATFNIYGAVKDNRKTFGDLEGFLRWRVGLMERSVRKLDLSNATQPIPDYGEGPDPYQGFQIHDYLQVSFLWPDPLVRVASKKTIEVVGRYYPETLSRKIFVNVPAIMGWMFQAMKKFVAKETVSKFVVVSYGEQLVAELGQGVPKVYGGSAGPLTEIGEGVNLKD